jgi:CheY-like chemotaxis protein
MPYFPSDRAKQNLTDHPDWGTGDKLRLHFSVEDTGRGLDEHEKKLLFQRFSQTTPRTHVQYGGSGLGLFISRILTDLQGGQIGVLSQKGVGSTFSFYIRCRMSNGPADKRPATTAPLQVRALGSNITENLTPEEIERLPLAAQDAHGRRGQAQAADGHLQPQRLTPAPCTAPSRKGPRLFDVLIVEDNLVNQKVLRRQLHNVGNQTQVANHGEEALEVIRRSRFWRGAESTGDNISVILMDLEMPVMDGMTCARRIRELEREGTIVSHIPIIAVTAYARPGQIEDAKGVGIVSYELFSCLRPWVEH